MAWLGYDTEGLGQGRAGGGLTWVTPPTAPISPQSCTWPSAHSGQ